MDHSVILQHCTLCPRLCGADRLHGQRGACGADGRLFVSRAALHPWEEPPISGECGSGTVFFAHCSLRCVFCQNREISRGTDVGKEISTAHLAEVFLSLQAQGAHNINLVTGTHYIPQIIEALDIVRGKDLKIPILFNCGGYDRVQSIRMLDGYVDIYLPDYKYYSTYYAELYSAAPDYSDCATEAIEEMVHQTGAVQFGADGMLQKGVVVRHLMLPGLGGDTAQVLSRIAERWGNQVLVSLMRQYTPIDMGRYPEINRRITDAEYEEAIETMQMLGLSGFLQDKESIGSSFIPSFHGEGV